MLPAKITSTNHCCPKLTHYTVSSPRSARSLFCWMRNGRRLRDADRTEKLCWGMFWNWHFDHFWNFEINLRVDGWTWPELIYWEIGWQALEGCPLLIGRVNLYDDNDHGESNHTYYMSFMCGTILKFCLKNIDSPYAQHLPPWINYLANLVRIKRILLAILCKIASHHQGKSLLLLKTGWHPKETQSSKSVP